MRGVQEAQCPVPPRRGLALEGCHVLCIWPSYSVLSLPAQPPDMLVGLLKHHFIPTSIEVMHDLRGGQIIAQEPGRVWITWSGLRK